MASVRPDISVCPRNPSLNERPLLTVSQGEGLSALFKVLANGTRLRMLHALYQEGDIRVNDLANLLDMKPQAISNQLQRLADRGVLSSRRNGSNVFYRIADPCVAELLEHGLCLSGEAVGASGSANGNGTGGRRCL
jgi:ArsR family transcriptional regulator, lead/cadmium/zinc/bismuth-responsive transcriptional repressor